MSNQQENKTFEEDGTRLIESNSIKIASTFEECGTRPIVESPDFLLESQSSQSNTKESADSLNTNAGKQENSNDLDEERPINNSDAEVVDTFEEDGTRPIAKSPDFLLESQSSQSNTKEPADSLNTNAGKQENSNDLDADKVLEIDGKRPVDNSDAEVVDTFEEDGTRPIMANKYEVVDTLDIDGERPITSNNS